MKKFKKGVSFIAVIAFLIIALIPVSGIAAAGDKPSLNSAVPAGTNWAVEDLDSATVDATTGAADDEGTAVYIPGQTKAPTITVKWDPAASSDISGVKWYSGSSKGATTTEITTGITNKDKDGDAITTWPVPVGSGALVETTLELADASLIKDLGLNAALSSVYVTCVASASPDASNPAQTAAVSFHITTPKITAGAPEQSPVYAPSGATIPLSTSDVAALAGASAATIDGFVGAAISGTGLNAPKDVVASDGATGILWSGNVTMPETGNGEWNMSVGSQTAGPWTIEPTSLQIGTQEVTQTVQVASPNTATTITLPTWTNTPVVPPVDPTDSTDHAGYVLKATVQSNDITGLTDAAILALFNTNSAKTIGSSVSIPANTISGASVGQKCVLEVQAYQVADTTSADASDSSITSAMAVGNPVTYTLEVTSAAPAPVTPVTVVAAYAATNASSTTIQQGSASEDLTYAVDVTVDGEAKPDAATYKWTLTPDSGSVIDLTGAEGNGVTGANTNTVTLSKQWLSANLTQAGSGATGYTLNCEVINKSTGTTVAPTGTASKIVVGLPYLEADSAVDGQIITKGTNQTINLTAKNIAAGTTVSSFTWFKDAAGVSAWIPTTGMTAATSGNTSTLKINASSIDLDPGTYAFYCTASYSTPASGSAILEKPYYVTVKEAGDSLLTGPGSVPNTVAIANSDATTTSDMPTLTANWMPAESTDATLADASWSVTNETTGSAVGGPYKNGDEQVTYDANTPNTMALDVASILKDQSVGYYTVRCAANGQTIKWKIAVPVSGLSIDPAKVVVPKPAASATVTVPLTAKTAEELPSGIAYSWTTSDGTNAPISPASTTDSCTVQVGSGVTAGAAVTITCALTGDAKLLPNPNSATAAITPASLAPAAADSVQEYFIEGTSPELTAKWSGIADTKIPVAGVTSYRWFVAAATGATAPANVNDVIGSATGLNLPSGAIPASLLPAASANKYVVCQAMNGSTVVGTAAEWKITAQASNAVTGPVTIEAQSVKAGQQVTLEAVANNSGNPVSAQGSWTIPEAVTAGNMDLDFTQNPITFIVPENYNGASPVTVSFTPTVPEGRAVTGQLTIEKNETPQPATLEITSPEAGKSIDAEQGKETATKIEYTPTSGVIWTAAFTPAEGQETPVPAPTSDELLTALGITGDAENPISSPITINPASDAPVGTYTLTASYTPEGGEEQTKTVTVTVKAASTAELVANLTDNRILVPSISSYNPAQVQAVPTVTGAEAASAPFTATLNVKGSDPIPLDYEWAGGVWTAVSNPALDTLDLSDSDGEISVTITSQTQTISGSGAGNPEAASDGHSVTYTYRVAIMLRGGFTNSEG